MGIEKIFSKKQLALFPKIHKVVEKEEKESHEAFGYKAEYKSDMSNNAYYFYPMLFTNSEICLSEDAIVEFISAGVLYYNFVIAFDRKLDGQNSNNTWSLLYYSLLAQRSIEKLSKLFGDKSELYFEYMHRYVSEYIEAIRIETSEPEYFNNAELRNKVLRGKSAISKCFSAGMAILSGHEEEIEVMDAFQDSFNTAFQIFDDFKDIKEDIAAKNKNWVNSIVFEAEDGKVYEKLFYSGKLAEVFEQIVFLCNKSISLSGKYPAWIRNVRCFLEKVCHVYEDITGRHIGIIKISNDLEICSCKEKMVDFFKKIYKNDKFTETDHYMNFYHEEGYTSDVEQVGNIFVKTEMINLLCDSNASDYFSEIRSQWQNEIWDFKTKWFNYGWSYFPNLKELAPDVDSLSEIMRLFRNDSSARDYIIECIEFVINNCLHEDGSIDTWMISKDNLNEYELIAKREAQNRWQIRQDIEVVANFLFSLSFYKNDIPKYNEICEKGYEYLIRNKGGNGLWSSSWYCGDMYGTYMCMNFFKTLDDKSNDLKALANDLLLLFNEEGEYIHSTNINDYVLAILIVLGTFDFTENVEKVKRIISTARDFIPTIIDETGFCCAMPFIKLGSITYFGKSGDKEVKYSYDNLFESQLLTSAFVFNCLSKIEAFCNDNGIS